MVSWSTLRVPELQMLGRCSLRAEPHLILRLPMEEDLLALGKSHVRAGSLYYRFLSGLQSCVDLHKIAEEHRPCHLSAQRRHAVRRGAREARGLRTDPGL